MYNTDLYLCNLSSNNDIANTIKNNDISIYIIFLLFFLSHYINRSSQKR